jgi:hypothetical protein
MVGAALGAGVSPTLLGAPVGAGVSPALLGAAVGAAVKVDGAVGDNVHPGTVEPPPHPQHCDWKSS